MSGFHPPPPTPPSAASFIPPMQGIPAPFRPFCCPPHILMHFLEARSHLTVYCLFSSLLLRRSWSSFLPALPASENPSLFFFFLLLRLSFSIGSFVAGEWDSGQTTGANIGSLSAEEDDQQGGTRINYSLCFRSPCVRLDL
ncbi:hypothetical protein CEXT_368731 [Caerostris extrusa]|uniref:Uncharacterized protein n=1 Tax=Caerostris extrusa TaxID=172846 RepID=A0AAV4Q5S7_CAEEX|nr:hypothetical protein CEXT_368731 [Caerostris extrusa]